MPKRSLQGRRVSEYTNRSLKVEKIVTVSVDAFADL